MTEKAGFIPDTNPPLYACWHRAEGEAQRAAQSVAVLVGPFAEEKKAAQRALVEMARALAEHGWDALRLDVRGTGDSGGEFGAATVAGWVDDLQVAIAQARAVAAGRPVCLIGLRFGAALAALALAALAAREGTGVDSLVLWEPVVSGATYMRQNRQRSQIRSQMTAPAADGSNATNAPAPMVGAEEPFPAFDFDGFPVGTALHRQMVEVDLLTDPLPGCRRALVLQISGSSRLKKPLEDLAARFNAAGIQAQADNVAVEPFWSAIGLVDTAPVRERTLAWLGAGGQATGDRGQEAGGRRQEAKLVAVAEMGAVRAEALDFMSGEQRVRGVLYRPASGTPQRAVLLLHGWSGYRSGPGQLLTHTARDLAALGYASYSFDFRGRGESELEVGQASLNSMIRDAARAVPVVLERTGATRVALLGLCSGGEVAIGASLMDERIDALVLWSAPVFSGAFDLARQARRSRSALKEYVAKLFLPETWAKLVTGRLNFKMIARALSGGRSNEDAAIENKAPDTQTQMHDFEAFRGRLLFIYGGSDPETPPSRDFYRAFVERTKMPAEFHEIAGANHNFYSLTWQREIIDLTLRWLALK